MKHAKKIKKKLKMRQDIFATGKKESGRQKPGSQNLKKG